MLSRFRAHSLRISTFRSYRSLSSVSRTIPFDTQPFPFDRFEPCCPDEDVAPSSNGFVPCKKHPIPNVLGRKIDMTETMTGRLAMERHMVMCVGPHGKEWERAKVEAVVDGPVYASNQLHSQYLRSPAHRNNDTPPTNSVFLTTVCDRVPEDNGTPNTAAASASPSCDVMVFPEFIMYPRVDPSQLAESDVAQVLETLWKDPSSSTLPPVANQTTIKEELGHDVDAVVLVCTHERRDMRCGKIGPLIVNAFKKSLEHRLKNNNKKVLVYGTSHFGGHKFAGNVIIHQKGLGGHMYGNVRDCMVDDLVDRHIINGKVVKELWRGVVTPPSLKN